MRRKRKSKNEQECLSFLEKIYEQINKPRIDDKSEESFQKQLESMKAL